MPFFDKIDAIRLASDRPFLQRAWIFSEPHHAAERLDADQIAQLEDHLVRRFVIELGRIRTDHPADIAGELDRRALHAETNPEVGDLFFARITDRAQLTFDAARAEARSDQDRVDLGQLPVVALILERFGVDVDDSHPHVVRDSAVDERLVERLV